MPVSFLTAAQRERLGRYPEALSTRDLARYFHFDDDDRERIDSKRRDNSRSRAEALAHVRLTWQADLDGIRPE